ncbi:MAG: endonuclease domain-containing protein [Merismopediaceae bacterium]|nr:endonuclease domain-containing protein [Merismopediaceae bacterium]
MTTLKEGKYFLPYNPQLIARAREMRKNPTLAERKLWGYLRNFPVKMWRQKPINQFIVDFYCPKLKLVIEVDGDSHFTQEGLVYDQERTQILENYGLKVVRFTNYEVLNNFEVVCEKIMSYYTLNFS